MHQVSTAQGEPQGARSAANDLLAGFLEQHCLYFLLLWSILFSEAGLE